MHKDETQAMRSCDESGEQSKKGKVKNPEGWKPGNPGKKTRPAGLKTGAFVLGYTDLTGAKKYCGDCSSATIYRRVKSGELTLYKLGSKTLFKIEELEALPVPQPSGPAGVDNAEI